MSNYIFSGDLLRRHVAQRTSIGRTVEQCINRGDLVPDGIVMDFHAHRETLVRIDDNGPVDEVTRSATTCPGAESL